MLDDNRDKELIRNQLIAIVLMTLLVVAWFHFYGHRPSPTPEAPQPITTTEPTDSDDSAAAAAGSPSSPEAAEPSSPDQWPFLPDVPVQGIPADDEITLENGHLRLVFTRIGARLKQAYVLLDEEGKDNVQLVPEIEKGRPDTSAVLPFGLRFTNEALADALDYRRFDAEVDPAGRSVVFRLALGEAAVVRKTFSLNERPFVIDVDIAYENREPSARILGMDTTPAFSLNWGPNVSSGDEKKGVKQGIYWRKEAKVLSHETGKLGSGLTVPEPDWVAIKSAYFVVAVKPEFEGARMWAEGQMGQFRLGVSAPRLEVAPGETHEVSYATYVGPSQLKTLASAWDTLPEVQRFFKSVDIMDRFAKLLLAVLNWFHAHVIGNYGLAIIFLTVVVRSLMYPLTLKSMRSMKKMQLLAPEIEELKKKHGGDPQELNKHMMELYKERGVNPMGGCLPMMLQMPVFIVLYRMLWSAYELRGAPFVFWITDLSEPDRLFRIPGIEHVPFLSSLEYLNLLPILMGVAMVLSQKLTPTSGPAQNPQQKFMMTFMPIFFSFICYNMASGLNLYILTSTLLGIVQQHFTRAGDEKTEPKKKTPRKRQHFYAAAQQRKRRLAQEAKQERLNKQRARIAAKKQGSGTKKRS
ncbi:MAG TPA: membrane protein insertase YidC [Candidatus Hydrogenedentes bacterium]|nr:membrane protein insertase YidC [Candidatus Hydrogenedentota bacterium]HPG68033.1 membrane protein insertase YidC [Candidatus Hydrogenedentota bacterium]